MVAVPNATEKSCMLRTEGHHCVWQLGQCKTSWLQCKMLQPLWKAVKQFLTKLHIVLQYDSAIVFLGIYPNEIKLMYTQKPAHGCVFFKVFFTFLKKNYLFLAALGLCCCARAFSSCGEWGLLFVVLHGLLIAVASLVAELGLQACGFQQLWLAGSRAHAQSLWLTGLVAPQHVGSSWTRAQSRVPCISRRILNH